MPEVSAGVAGFSIILSTEPSKQMRSFWEMASGRVSVFGDMGG